MNSMPWLWRAENGSAVTVTSNKFTMPESNVIVSATFKEVVVTGETTATINFGYAKGSTAINSTSVTGVDSQSNSWTVTTVMQETSFTQNASYSQIGSKSKPATSITFTTTLPDTVTKVTALSINMGGFSGTAGTVTLKVGESTVGTGTLSGGDDITVSSTTEANGRTITISVTGISKGVKVYGISATYN